MYVCTHWFFSPFLCFWAFWQGEVKPKKTKKTHPHHVCTHPYTHRDTHTDLQILRGHIQVITITSWRVSEDTLVQNRWRHGVGGGEEGRRGAGVQGGRTGPVYFNNNSQTQGLSSQTLNETLGLWWSDNAQMLKRGLPKQPLDHPPPPPRKQTNNKLFF